MDGKDKTTAFKCFSRDVKIVLITISSDQPIRFCKLAKGKEYAKTFQSQGNSKTAIRDAERKARQFAKEIEAHIQLGNAQYTSNVTFKEYSEEFFKYHSIGKKKLTIRNYNSNLNQLYPYFGHLKLVDIDAIMLDRYFMRLKENGLSMSTIKKRRDILSLIFNSDVKKQIIPDNPLNRIDFVFEEPYRDRSDMFVPFNEFITIYNSFEADHYKDFMLIALFSGMRTGEILALTLDDIDLKNKILYVNKSVNRYLEVGPPKSPSSVRKIYIHSFLEKTIVNRIEKVERNKQLLGKEYNDNNLLICKEDGSYINPERLSKYFNEKNKIYGTRVTPHKLHHTFSTLANKANINLKDLQALLGHSAPEISLTTYTHNTGYNQDTVAKLENIFIDFFDSLRTNNGQSTKNNPVLTNITGR